MNTIVNNFFCHFCRTWKVVFEAGPFVRSTQPVTKTPQYSHRHKLYFNEGEPDVLFNLTADQQFNLKVKSFKDSHGNVATVDGVPTWATDNSEIVALTPSEDGMSCIVKSVGMAGGANVQMTADAQMGNGVKAIVGTALINVTAGEATVVELEGDTPVNQ